MPTLHVLLNDYIQLETSAPTQILHAIITSVACTPATDRYNSRHTRTHYVTPWQFPQFDPASQPNWSDGDSPLWVALLSCRIRHGAQYVTAMGGLLWLLRIWLARHRLSVCKLGLPVECSEVQWRGYWRSASTWGWAASVAEHLAFRMFYFDRSTDSLS